MAKKHTYEKLLNPAGNYIAGAFTKPKDKAGAISIKSPADLTDNLGSYDYGYHDVDNAVSAARDGFLSWSTAAQSTRMEYLVKYRDALKKIEARLAETIAREVGKPLWEAKGEVATMVNKVDVTINEGMPRVAEETIAGIMPGTTGITQYRPHGVFVVLGPFNFPGHLANGHIVPALLAGNCVIFKPSEKSPATGQLMAEAFHEAGLPAGVFNLVQGEREVGRRLATHEGIDGVLFTGSYEVGLKIKQDTLQQYWKLLALEMGGKNATIICEDALLDAAIYETMSSAFLTAGQRCTATSRVIVHRSLYQQFVEKFHERAKKFRIGHPLENPFMGSLIDAAAVEKYMTFTGIAEREGCEIVMRGKALELEWSGYYVTPSICLVQDSSLQAVKKSVYQQSEIFGPNVAIYAFDDVDEAVNLANATQYGLAASVFTAQRKTFSRASAMLRAGVINWNRSTVGASSRLPFGGIKRSGNHVPAAISAIDSCVYPVAMLEVDAPAVPAQALPGMEWS